MPPARVRVSGGELRGFQLAEPGGARLRPTSALVREAVFNVLGGRVEGAAALDLFAGTGALGVEALSRGAARAVFVENHRGAARARRGRLQRDGDAQLEAVGHGIGVGVAREHPAQRLEAVGHGHFPRRRLAVGLAAAVRAAREEQHHDGDEGGHGHHDEGDQAEARTRRTPPATHGAARQPRAGARPAAARRDERHRPRFYPPAGAGQPHAGPSRARALYWPSAGGPLRDRPRESDGPCRTIPFP